MANSSTGTNGYSKTEEIRLMIVAACEASSGLLNLRWLRRKAGPLLNPSPETTKVSDAIHRSL